MGKRLLARTICQELRDLSATSPGLRRREIFKLYELFVLSCILRALKDVGAVLTPKDGSGHRINGIIFRMGPGKIYGSASTDYIHIKWSNRRSYEAHNSLYITGTSGIDNEADVCIIGHRHGRGMYRRRKSPNEQFTSFFVECKHYGKPNLPQSLGREFVGLSEEFSSGLGAFVANKSNENISQIVSAHNGARSFKLTPSDKLERLEFIRWLRIQLLRIL